MNSDEQPVPSCIAREGDVMRLELLTSSGSSTRMAIQRSPCFFAFSSRRGANRVSLPISTSGYLGRPTVLA